MVRGHGPGPCERVETSTKNNKKMGDKPPSRLFSKMTLKAKDNNTRARELNAEYPDLGEFELLDTLGTGTFGRVRLCRHSNEKYFALKILKKNEIIRLKQVEHIISEKKILGKVDHPFIVKLCVRSSRRCRTMGACVCYASRDSVRGRRWLRGAPAACGRAVERCSGVTSSWRLVLTHLSGLSMICDRE